MNITIASGKGGTGKTTFSVNLAWVLAQNGQMVQLLDADVEEPNDHLFVNPEFTEERTVKVFKPKWDSDTCTACGICARECRYNALAVVKDQVLVFNELCHACGVCSYVCPNGALQEQAYEIGRLRIAPSHTPFYFADGVLNVGEPSAPSVIKQLKQLTNPEAISIMDAAPGTGCPVVEALEGSDVALLVTEPTPFGLHDLKLAAQLSLKMGIPTGIIVNRSEQSNDLIADFAESTGIPIVGRIPFKRAYAELYSRGAVIAEHAPELQTNLLAIYQNIQHLIKHPPQSHVQELSEHIASEPPSTIKKGQATEYRELAVISGKGGTGKTTVTAALAQLSDETIMADNDVDASDLHLLLKPRVYEVHDYYGGLKASILSERCIGCGQCAEACHFDAISIATPSAETDHTTYAIDNIACEGCSLCHHVCPAEAVTLQEARTGAWYVSDTDTGLMVHAALGIGEENSGKLVTQVRQRAAELANEYAHTRIISDGPPGTSCPVIASINGADHVLIVTEPTVSGVHDLKRVLDLCRHFNIPASVAINKADLNTDKSAEIREMASSYHATIAGEIPFDRNVHQSLMNGQSVLEYGQGPAADAIRSLWNKLCMIMQK